MPVYFKQISPVNSVYVHEKASSGRVSSGRSNHHWCCQQMCPAERHCPQQEPLCFVVACFVDIYFACQRLLSEQVFVIVTFLILSLEGYSKTLHCRRVASEGAKGVHWNRCLSLEGRISEQAFGICYMVIAICNVISFFCCHHCCSLQKALFCYFYLLFRPWKDIPKHCVVEGRLVSACFLVDACWRLLCHCC